MPRKRSETTDMRQVAKDKYGSLATSSHRGGLTWKEADVSLLHRAVVAVTEDGAALLFTSTSDGGALCLQVWTQSARHKLYPATALEIEEALQLVIDAASS